MAGILALTSTISKTKSGVSAYKVTQVAIAPDGSLNYKNGVATVQEICNLVNSGKVRLCNAKVEGNNIIECFGKMERIKPKNGINPVIIVCAYTQTRGSETSITGYGVLSPTEGVRRISRQALLDSCEKAEKAGVPYIQNGIYRTANDVKVIANYEGNQYIAIDMGTLKGKPKTTQTSQPTKTPVPQKTATPNIRIEEAEPIRVSVARPPEAQPEVTSGVDTTYLNRAKEVGLDPLCADNINLSAESQELILKGKSEGAHTEYLTHPNFKPNDIAYFSLVLGNDDAIYKYKDVIDSDFSSEQLRTLAYGIQKNVDISEIADPKYSVNEMQNYIEERIELNDRPSNLSNSMDDFIALVDRPDLEHYLGERQATGTL